MITKYFKLLIACLIWGSSTFALSDYQTWKSKENFFVDYIDEIEAARVIFIGSSAHSTDEQGNRPTVSEGMGYGLLLAYAHDDQMQFDRFLRYVLWVCSQYSCLEQNKQGWCIKPCYFLMPWLTNNLGKPFWYRAGRGATAQYSSGSASDADIQIAWAIYLATQKVKTKEWKDQYFETNVGKLSYNEIFDQMVREIRLYDVDPDTKALFPGNQWHDSNIFFPGYITPQAFLVFDKAPKILKKSFELKKSDPSTLYVSIINYEANNIYLFVDHSDGKVYLSDYIVENQNLSLTVPALCQGNLIYTGPNKNGRFLYINLDNPKVVEFNPDLKMRWQDGKWIVDTVDDQLHYTFSNNQLTIYVGKSENPHLQFTFQQTLSITAQVMLAFQQQHNKGLFPNMIYLNNKYASEWEKSFSFDAVRFCLWSAPYLQEQSDFVIQNIFNALISDKGIIPFIHDGKNGWTFPSQGVDVFSNKAIGGWDNPAIALNAPIYLALKYNDHHLASHLHKTVKQYQLEKHQPLLTDKKGNSSAYYDAVIYLLVQAFLEKKL